MLKFSVKNKSLTATKQIPDHHKEKMIRSAQAEYFTYDNGQLLLQSFKKNNFNLYLIDHMCTEEQHLHINSSEPFGFMLCGLKSCTDFNNNLIGNFTIQKGCYNIYCLPELQLTAHFQPVEQRIIMIQLSKKYILSIKSILQHAKGFFTKITRFEATQLHNTPEKIEGEIGNILQQMLYFSNIFQGQQLDQYLNIKLTELMLQIFHLSNPELPVAPLRKKDLVRMQDMEAYMRDNLHENLTIDKLVRKFNLNHQKIYTDFKQVYKQNPMSYLRILRLEKACELVVNTTDSIEAIAEQLGYTRSSAFIYAFRERYGVAPACYRKKNNSCCLE
ncbi:helix-turn-helix domain-containing protein [Chitinophaga nivalis]|uniref:AraC family transcriptional regulator n=1 Tax=Chitinophaga nivalis TaxID=2991709 RepID=A0ABT3IR43_9BACT|nr:AraC family transcriptional regulator [Chitinophaga nivalis]MCW3464121.1 AraC family transcriptional regulator [Chitinophaga nivalis]MCW3486189.1 AraC family transcriptional regulator [Chitinophaga nivalis]